MRTPTFTTSIPYHLAYAHHPYTTATLLPPPYYRHLPRDKTGRGRRRDVRTHSRVLSVSSWTRCAAPPRDGCDAADFKRDRDDVLIAVCCARHRRDAHCAPLPRTHRCGPRTTATRCPPHIPRFALPISCCCVVLLCCGAWDGRGRQRQRVSWRRYAPLGLYRTLLHRHTRTRAGFGRNRWRAELPTRAPLHRRIHPTRLFDMVTAVLLPAIPAPSVRARRYHNVYAPLLRTAASLHGALSDFCTCTYRGARTMACGTGLFA